MKMQEIFYEGDQLVMFVASTLFAAEVALQGEDPGRCPGFDVNNLRPRAVFFGRQPVSKLLQQHSRRGMEGVAEGQKESYRPTAVIEDIGGGSKQLALFDLVGGVAGGCFNQVRRCVLGTETKFTAALVKIGSRQYRQREDVDLVGLLLQGKVKAVAEPRVVVAGQSVNQVESENNAGQVKLMQCFAHPARIDLALQGFEDFRVR